MRTSLKTLQRLLTPYTLAATLLFLPSVGRTQQFFYGVTNGTVTVTAYSGPAEVIIPPLIEGMPVTAIETGFLFCTSTYTSLSIPSTVTNIPPGGPVACYEMMNITVDPSNPCYSSRDGVLFDKNQIALIAFPIAKSSSYVIPEGVTTIGAWAFAYSRRLTTVTIPSSVRSIGEWAFVDCSLTGVRLPSGLSDIPDCAFLACPLQELTIPNSVTSIGSQAFANCFPLANLIIPQSVRTLGDWAFHGCSNLTTVQFNGDAPAADATIFQETPATVFYLPGTIGWGLSFGGAPTDPWHLPNPLILSFGPSFGISANAFGFRISWATNASVVVEASTTGLQSTWVPTATNTLVDGWTDYLDPEPASHPARFYRVRLP